jgi:nitroreductase
VRKALTPASLHQSQVEDCSHFVVFTAKTSIDEAYVDLWVSEMAHQRQISKEALRGYSQMVIDDIVRGRTSPFVGEWAARQTYLALGTLVTTAALMKIDSCPMEGIEPEKYDEILNLKGSGYRTLAGCALGYRSLRDGYSKSPKVRFRTTQVVQYV